MASWRRGVVALWDWEPIAAVAAVGTTVTATLVGVILLLRGRAEESWGNALAASLALMAAAAGMALLSHLAGKAVLDAVVWPFRQLANGFR